jgi:hypothetical protein
MSTARELVFFDPFFGGVMQRIPFASDCSSTLITDSAHATVFVLDTGSTGNGRIHAIDFATGSETAVFDLPNPVYALWCEGTPGAEVYVAEMDLSGQTSVRHVALEPFADLGSTVVGTSHEDMGFANLVYSAGQVFAATAEWQDPGHSFYWDGCITRCRFSGSSVETSVEVYGLRAVNLLTPVPDADRLLATWHFTFTSGGGLDQMPLAIAGPSEGIPFPPSVPDWYPAIVVADGTSAWVIGRSDEDPGFPILRLDLGTMTWIPYPYIVSFDQPAAAELLRDAWNHELWIANTPNVYLRVRPEISVVDELQSTTRHIRLDRPALGLFGVPMP